MPWALGHQALGDLFDSAFNESQMEFSGENGGSTSRSSLLFLPREDGFQSGRSVDDSSFLRQCVDLTLISSFVWRGRAGQYLTDGTVTTRHLELIVTSYVSTTQQKPNLERRPGCLGARVRNKLLFHCTP